MAIKFEWSGSDVLIKTITGNQLYTIRQARDAYHDGSDIVVISSTMSQIRFTKDGIRKFE
ncbi:MAG: hypothetical protein MJ158_00100 [Alphaproteobacteria bacterium]|nr:hypothetical protein [Alphaproteobacteria bacterium]